MPTYQAPGVYVEEVDSGSKPLAAAATSVAAFIGFTETEPDDDHVGPRLVTSWADYERSFGGFTPGAMLPMAVYGFFNNGGGRCYIVRVENTEDADTPPRAALTAPRQLPAGDDGGGKKGAAAPDAVPEPLLTVTAKTDAAGQSPPLSVVVGPANDKGEFNLVIEANGHEVQFLPRVTVATAIDALADSPYVTAEAGKGSGAPEPGRTLLRRPPAPPKTVTLNDFIGDEKDHSGLAGLVIQEDVNMVIVPDLVNLRTGDADADKATWRAMQSAVITHCEMEKNRLAVLDTPPDLSPQEAAEWRSNEAMYASPFAALYYPWITVANPIDPGATPTVTIPPSGHVAGVWARVDESRGVWKAPANEVVQGALGVARKVTKGEQEGLNPVGVNCIRAFGTSGIRVWGARTLAADPSWQYVNVRRLFSMIESSIKNGTTWVVFEPNDATLWERVRRTVSAFLLGLWRQGALFGTTPAEAFYVKCDAENNPPDVRDLGQLIIEVGIAPVKPAEFVVFRISQWAGPAGS